MKIADPELLLFAGGECLEKYGTLFKRVRPEGEALEVVTAPETRYFRDRQDVIRAAGVGVPTVDWQDYDGTGRRPVLVMERGETQLCEFSVPGGTPSDWELQELDGVTNLADEWAVQIDQGDLRKYPMPANFDPDAWDIIAVVIPNFSSADTETRQVFDLNNGAGAFIQLWWFGSGPAKWALTHNDGASSKGPAIAAGTFAAGDPILIAGRLDGSNGLTIYVDNDGDGELETATATANGPIAGGTWLGAVGANSGGNQPFEGAVNLVVTNDGSTDAAIQDRFNAGAGGAIGPWSARHGHALVLQVPQSTDGSTFTAKTEEGSAAAVTRNDTATQILKDGTIDDVAANILRDAHCAGRGPFDEGAYSFDGSGDWISYGDQTIFDGTPAATFFLDITFRDSGTFSDFLRRYGSTDDAKQFIVFRDNSDRMTLWFAADLLGGNAFGHTGAKTWGDGERAQFFLVYAGAGAADTDRVKIYYRDWSFSTSSWGAWTLATLTFGGVSIPATMTTPTTPEPFYIGGTSSHKGEIDDVRLNVDTALSTANRDAQTLYTTPEEEIAAGLWDHWFPMDGDPDDRIGTLTGTVTNAAQVSDGRRFVTTLVERGEGNKVTSDDLAAWTKTGALVVTGSVSDPTGGTGAYNVAGGGSEHIRRVVTLTGDGVKTVVYVVREAGGGLADICNLYDSTAAAQRCLHKITAWKGGEPIISSVIGTILFKQKLLDGYWAIYAQSISCTAANAHQVYVYPDVAGSGDLDVYRVNTYDRALPPASILDAAETTTSDDLTCALLDTAQQESNWLWEGVAYDFAGTGDYPVFFGVGAVGGGSGDLNVYLDGAGTAISVLLDNGLGGTIASSIATAGISWADWIAIRVYVSPSGALTLGLTIKDEDEVTAGPSSGLAFGTYGTAFVQIGDRSGGGTNNVARSGTIQLKGQSGSELTVAQLRALTQPDLASYFTNQPENQLTVAASVATKGSAFPMLDGFGGPSGVADAALEGSPSAVVPAAYDSALGTNVTRLDTGPAGTNARSYRFGLPGQLNGLTPGSWVSMAVGVYIPSSEAITPASVTVAVVDTAGETVGTAAASKGAWNELYVSHQVDAGATEAYLELRVHDGVALGTVDESLYFRTPTIVARKCRPRPFANAAEGTVAMSAEIISREWLPGPGAFADGFTVYGKILERGVSQNQDEALPYAFHIGSRSAGVTTPVFRLFHSLSSGGMKAVSTAGVAQVVVLGTADPALGETYEYAARFFPDGTIQLLERVEGGATLTTALSSEPGLPLKQAFAAEEITFGGDGTDGGAGFSGLLAGKVAIGTEWDLDQLEAAETLSETGV